MEKSKDKRKEFFSPSKTSPVIIRITPQCRPKSPNNDSSSLKVGEINQNKSSVQSCESQKDDSSIAERCIQASIGAFPVVVNLNNSANKGDLVKSTDSIPLNISKEKEAISSSPYFSKIELDNEESKDSMESSAADTAVCPIRVTKKRKLSQIHSPDAISSLSNSPHYLHITEDSSGSLPPEIRNVEISDLEKMREALKQQLEEHLFCSSDEEDEQPPSPVETQTTDLLEDPPPACDALVEEAPAESGALDSPETGDRVEERPIEPPLVMQSSNLLFNDGLDNGHGGGGVETTQEEEERTVEPPAKKPRLPEVDKKEDAVETVVNAETVDSDSAEKDDRASTSTVDPLNSEQNEVMEFDILDEFESDDNEANESESEESELSMDEIDALLEKDYQEKRGPKEADHEEKEKVILKVKGRDHFDVLPEGWIEVTHNSGMPIYLHKQSRVCSVSKPYFLGPGSTRKHEIPISAIPCLHYLRELEKENSTPDNQEDNCNIEPKEPSVPSEPSDNVKNAPAKPSTALSTNNSNKENTKVANSVIPSAKLESVKETKESGSLDYLAVREYCQKRFEFQTITVKRFKTWSGRRKHQKQMKKLQRPCLPDSTKLITCPLFPPGDKASTFGSNTKKEFIMNPNGKSPVCILHEYVQHTLRLQPKYIFKELESASTPYGAVVVIDDIEYGCGYGSSKKLAKSDAARSALEVLIPKIKMYPQDGENEGQDVEFFDQVRVEDPRVCDLSIKAGQPYPYQILLECLKRNYGMGDTEVEFSMNNLKHQKNEFFMSVGKHKVSVVCKNKRDGKHRAAQAVLQKLHPHVKSWGSLLRMYGKGSCKTLKEKKEEEQRITELQSKACVNKPNMSILNKLRDEMLKYRAKMISKKPIGKLIPEKMEFFSTSNSNLNNVEL